MGMMFNLGIRRSGGRVMQDSVSSRPEGTTQAGTSSVQLSHLRSVGKVTSVQYPPHIIHVNQTVATKVDEVN